LQETGVIPAKAGHAVKLLRYPGSDRLKTLDARLRGHDEKNSPTAEITADCGQKQYRLSV